jgi:hypothetical protein
MFKGRIRQWEFNKNIRGDDWAALAILHKIRKDSGKRSTEFLVHGKKKTVADLRRHIKSKNMSEDEFLAAALDSTIPDHVRSYTPDLEKREWSPNQSSGEELSSPSSTKSAQPNALRLSPTSSPSFLSPFNDTSSISHYDPSLGDLPTPSTRITEYSHPEGAPHFDDCPDYESDFVMVSPDITQLDDACDVLCDQVQRDVVTMASQLLKPTSLMTSYGAEDIPSVRLMCATPPPDSAWQPPHLCSKCHRPSSTHFISLARLAPPNTVGRNLLNNSQGESMTLPSTTKDYDGATRWVSLCFSACIYMSRAQAEFGTKSLADAATVFENMLIKRDGLIFTALHLMVTILHMHNQGHIAESIVHSATAVAERLLGPEDPIRLTLQFEEAAAGVGLSKSNINSTTLRKIFEDFKEKLTISHPWTIAALYNLAWMLLWEGSYSQDREQAEALYTEAEDKLQKLYQESCSTLTPQHMQSITALTTLSRAQSNLGKQDAAIETISKAIRDCRYTLGRSHPFRLEAKRRLASMYEAKGQRDKMEILYWDVLRGRVMMLGRNHPYTDGARIALTDLLKDLGKWDENGEAKWMIDELFEKTSESSSQHEAF